MLCALSSAPAGSCLILSLQACPICSGCSSRAAFLAFPAAYIACRFFRCCRVVAAARLPFPAWEWPPGSAFRGAILGFISDIVSGLLAFTAGTASAGSCCRMLLHCSYSTKTTNFPSFQQEILIILHNAQKQARFFVHIAQKIGPSWPSWGLPWAWPSQGLQAAFLAFLGPSLGMALPGPAGGLPGKNAWRRGTILFSRVRCRSRSPPGIRRPAGQGGTDPARGDIPGPRQEGRYPLHHAPHKKGPGKQKNLLT